MAINGFFLNSTCCINAKSHLQLLSTRNKIPSARSKSLCCGIPPHSSCSPSEFYRQNHLLSSVTDDETLTIIKKKNRGKLLGYPADQRKCNRFNTEQKNLKTVLL
jgi:hypothetical protein